MRKLALLLALLPAPVLAEADPFAVTAIEQCLEETSETGRARDCIGVLAGSCMEEPEGQTTVGMMFCTGDEADAWDVLLNVEYQRAQRTAKNMDRLDAEDFPEFAVRSTDLLAAQRAWIAFRDANCAAAYGFYGAGTMRQIMGANCRLYMTAERMIALREIYDVVQ